MTGEQNEDLNTLCRQIVAKHNKMLNRDTETEDDHFDFYALMKKLEKIVNEPTKNILILQENADVETITGGRIHADVLNEKANRLASNIITKQNFQVGGDAKKEPNQVLSEVGRLEILLQNLMGEVDAFHMKSSAYQAAEEYFHLQSGRNY